jgi:hypothetical protein
MSILLKTSLAAAFAVGLAATGTQAAVQTPGFSITLSDVTFVRGSKLSAEAAAFGIPPNQLPAVQLPNNGQYNETATGDYTVSDTLPPSDEEVLWQTFTQISLNGVPFFRANGVAGPESQDDIWSGILSITGLSDPQLKFLRAVMVNHNVFSTGGELDYAYNPPATASDRTTGTFAIGSSKELSIENFGSYVDPLASFDSIPVPDGPNVWSLTFSATVFTIPEPPIWLMLMAGGAGLLVIRGLARRPTMGRRVSA